jgi:Fe-S cluster assembly protein SufD
MIRPLCDLQSIPKGVTIDSIARLANDRPEWLMEHLGSVVATEENGVTAINAAQWRDGYVLHVPAGVVLDRAVEVIYMSSSESKNATMQIRNLIIAEQSSQVSLVEVFVGSHGGAYWVNQVTEVKAAPAARVAHVRLQEESHQAFHFSRMGVEQKRDSHVSSHVITTGGRQGRQALSFLLEEAGAECTLDGLFVLNGQQKADHQTLVDHKSPHTTSTERYKGALDGASEGSFTGRVLVRQDAQQVVANQQNPNLLLSDLAKVNTRPQLEIFADDVKCSHGATCGRLDDAALFYLRSRGIPATRARQLLTRAFVSEVIQSIPIPAVRDHLLPLVDDRLCPGHLLEETP